MSAARAKTLVGGVLPKKNRVNKNAITMERLTLNRNINPSTSSPFPSSLEGDSKEVFTA